MAILWTGYELNPADPGYVIQHDHLDNGMTVDTIVPVAGAPAAVANYASIVTRARTALANNQTFLALASPTTAQNAAQVAALTRQMDAIIYFLLHELTGLSTIPGA